MTKSIAILVERHRDPEGHPTCCRHVGDAQCRFLGFSVANQTDQCNLLGSELHRFGYIPGSTEWAAEGWVRPATGCPVWPQIGGAA